MYKRQARYIGEVYEVCRVGYVSVSQLQHLAFCSASLALLQRRLSRQQGKIEYASVAAHFGTLLNPKKKAARTSSFRRLSSDRRRRMHVALFLACIQQLLYVPPTEAHYSNLIQYYW